MILDPSQLPGLASFSDFGSALLYLVATEFADEVERICSHGLRTSSYISGYPMPSQGVIAVMTVAGECGLTLDEAALQTRKGRRYYGKWRSHAAALSKAFLGEKRYPEVKILALSKALLLPANTRIRLQDLARAKSGQCDVDAVAVALERYGETQGERIPRVLSPLEIEGNGRRDEYGDTEPDRSEVGRYLAALVRRLDRVPIGYPSHLTLRHLRRNVRVIVGRTSNFREGEPNRAGLSTQNLLASAAVYRRRAADVLAETGRHARPWNELRGVTRRVVVLGEPGYGKSWLLRHEAIRVAEAARQDLPTGLDDLQLPLYAHFSAVAYELRDRSHGRRRLVGEPTADEVADAIVRAAATTLPTGALTDSMRAWIGARLAADGPLFIFLDGWDEVPPADRVALRSALACLCESLERVRLTCSSRFAGYHDSPIPLEGPGDLEVELLAFEPDDLNGFVRQWFQGDDNGPRRFREALARSAILRDQARVPVLASFLCLAASAGTVPPSRAAIYDRALFSLLRQTWRDPVGPNEGSGLTDETVRMRLELLEDIAWHFASDRQGWHEFIDPGELDHFIREHELYAILSRRDSAAGHDTLTGLSGVLSSVAGPGAADPAVAPYAFVHRSIHEYLVARHVKRRDAASVREVVTQHAWLDADWVEVFPMLLSVLRPTPARLEECIRFLMNESDRDAFYWIDLLLGRCVTELDGLDRYDELSSGVIRRLVIASGSLATPERQQAIAVLARIGDKAVGILEHLAGPDVPEGWAPGSPISEDCPDEDVIKALGAVGTDSAVQSLWRLCTMIDSETGRTATAAALALADAAFISEMASHHIDLLAQGPSAAFATQVSQPFVHALLMAIGTWSQATRGLMNSAEAEQRIAAVDVLGRSVSVGEISTRTSDSASYEALKLICDEGRRHEVTLEILLRFIERGYVLSDRFSLSRGELHAGTELLGRYFGSMVRGRGYGAAREWISHVIQAGDLSEWARQMTERVEEELRVRARGSRPPDLAPERQRQDIEAVFRIAAQYKRGVITQDEYETKIEEYARIDLRDRWEDLFGRIDSVVNAGDVAQLSVEHPSELALICGAFARVVAERGGSRAELLRWRDFLCAVSQLGMLHSSVLSAEERRGVEERIIELRPRWEIALQEWAESPG